MFNSLYILRKVFFLMLMFSSYTLFSQIITENFDTRPASWTNGGQLNYVSNGNTIQGTSSLRILKGEVAISPIFDASSFNFISVSFSFRARQMETGEQLRVEFFDGSNWQIMGSIVIDGVYYLESTNYFLNTVTIAAPANLPSNAQIRFSVVDPDNSDNNDRFFIDDVIIYGSMYCFSTGDDTDPYTTGIRLVDFNTISNPTPINIYDGYSDFTSISTTIVRGTTYPLTVNVNTDGNYRVYAIAWIDWDQDGVFNDANERYELGFRNNNDNRATNLSPLSITVPSNAVIGNTRMRVSAEWNEYPTSCETGFDGEVEDYSINVTCGSSNIWTGTVSDDWNIDGNWSCGEVPSITNNTDVLIPTGLSRYPIIYAAGNSGFVNNIEFENGSSLTVLDNSFEIAGTIVLDGIIDLEGESQLIQTTGSVFDNASTGSIEIEQQGEGNLYRYNYWSSPVYTATDVNGNYTTINDALRDGTNSTPGSIVYTSGLNGSISPVTLSTIWMYKFSDRNSDYSQWQFIGNSGKIYSAEGFSLKGTGAIGEQNYVFIGKPNNGTILLSVGADNNYLVGNPYPSALDANQFLMDNSPSGTGSIGGSGALYFWEHYGGNSHNLADYQAGYSTYSLSGGVPASSYPGLSGGSSVKGAPERYIPVGQGFFIEADADGGDIEFNNGQRIFVTESSGNSVFMKGSTTKGKLTDDNTIDLRPKFRIGFDAPEINHRQLLLTIDENASDAIDWGYDAAMYQLFDDDMFWLLDNSKYVIQATNEILGKKEFQLGIQTENGGEISIKIDELLNVSEDTKLYVKDNVTGMLHNISANDFEIYLEPGEYLGRFSIVFESNKPVVEEVILGDEIIVYMDNVNRQLIVKNSKNNKINTVQVFNTMGQLVSNWDNLIFDVEMNLPLQVNTGVYLVYINANSEIFSKKIVVE
ncbi:MAG: T9SS type A sorting domain-containing protein [Lutibacter sp.]|uniref:GEVED domain-containing protein n=1 Tax=Lutibacter sp. TaxID=1925666 RepID=UPI001852B6BF|nr:GEVED domain-containing protein [Lutibacter sp.]MBT8317948.1 T9SS type A sorting domain-containing protein [Lutibacter sp.]NNJ58806.1 T9SS type A sorting domain-containing protein [Lutibacter sp.]